MNCRCVISLIVALSLLAGIFAATAQREASSPAVAVVCVLIGDASVIAPPAAGRRSLQLFDWLPSGSLVKVARNSKVTLAFVSGKRLALDAGTEAKLSKDDLTVARGSVKLLEPVPTIPTLDSIAASNYPGVSAGVVRIRGSKGFPYMYPRTGTAALPTSVVLRYSKITGAARYRIILRIEDHVLLDLQSEATETPIPSDLLTPGAQYHWTVAAMDDSGSIAQGETNFFTLEAETIKERAALKSKLNNMADAESLALLAEVDRRIGLHMEAREEFRAALAKSGGDQTIRAMVDQIEKLLFEK